MCGIAGFSLDPESTVDRTLAAQALLAGISERGADAVGYAHRGAASNTRVTKLRGGASALLDELAVPAETQQALIHVRDFTKGHPDIEANNHPIRHGTVVGIHNGIVLNDDSALNASRTTVSILGSDGSVRRLENRPKRAVARVLIGLAGQAS